ncbi:hypothetical protein LMG667_04710 [Xanthomonas euvesicatoria]|uniref:hypothetical protein n=1 Tax=Xanthomonas euvesicatoria TaxID=456327 RepID=UPI00080DC619|nr:hypothetical protein [Xanthomonas euvesicatoria]OCG89386.1 hypothetical protein LMG667_04710 [Xanthomonas euvesicatoria]
MDTMTKRKYRTLEAGQIWVVSRKSAGRGSAKVTRTESRRILHIAKGETVMVSYTTGGSSPRWCKRVAFLIWIRRYKAHKALPTTTRELVLTAPRNARASV